MISNWDFTINPANANFTENVNGGEVNFVTTSLTNDTVFWDFGDGTTSTTVNPTHLYTTSSTYTVTLTTTKCGKTTTVSKTLVITIDLSTDFVNNAKGFTLFPNPTSAIITIQFMTAKNILKLEIYDTRGLLLLTQNAINTDRVAVDVNALQSGIYWVKLQADGVVAVKRLVKK